MAEEKVAMSANTRRIVLWLSSPVVAFAIVGGFLSKATAREDTYPQLRIFADVGDKITGDYVDKVDVTKVMTGAMHGLADSLDPDSADLSSEIAAPGVGYLRIAAVSPRTVDQAKARIADLVKGGASKLIVDVRRASGGSLDGGIALAKLFVGTGTLTVRETRGTDKEP